MLLSAIITGCYITMNSTSYSCFFKIYCANQVKIYCMLVQQACLGISPRKYQTIILIKGSAVCKHAMKKT